MALLLVLSTLVVFAVYFAECSGPNLPPSFMHDMNNLVLSENTPVGEVVFTLEGTDPENSTVRFAIAGTHLLKVDPSTGKVTVAKPLDHEVNDTLNFSVMIEDEVADAPVGGNNVVEVPITVIVLDENDNAPAFENVPYVISVKEDAPIDTIVLSTVRVTDADTVGDAIEVECMEIDEADDACDTFKIRPDDSAQSIYRGSLVLKRSLDYGKRERYTFTLRATDGKLSNFTTVTATVEDVQNTPPVFTSPLRAEIGEDAPINTVLLVVHAEDGDKGAPRKIGYELINETTSDFLLDFLSGELRTARLLDKEAISNAEGLLTVGIRAVELAPNGFKAYDSEAVTEANVTILIRDVNDEPPSFNKKEYYVEVSEDAQVGSTLAGLDMIVSDPDTGNNSIFAVTLNDISRVLSVEPETVTGSSGIIIKVSEDGLDYEDPNQRKFIILVVAREMYTNPQLSSTATVTVTVNDANDNAPIFDRQSYSAVVSETAQSGTSVARVVAKDRDSGRFGDSGIVYQLVGSGSEKFLLDNRTGSVVVNSCDRPGSSECLDYETKHDYLLSVRATDDDGKGQTTSVPLRITLTDSNDNPPKFVQSVYNVYIDEDAVKFQPDLIITAEDLDSTSHLSYSITGGNADQTFNVDPNTGKIRLMTNKPLKYNSDGSKNNMVLTLEANDGKYSATTLINITINDVNDNAPLFDKDDYSATISEDAQIGSDVMRVMATDLDSGTNAQVTYGIRKGALNDFSIDNVTGTIRVASRLDYDRRNTYGIEVTATDYGSPSMSSTSSVTVRLFNVNNKLPYFTPAVQKVEVMKDAKVGTIVHNLIAFDPDINSSEALNYAASEPITATDKYGEPVQNNLYKGFFSIDKSTGKVSVANELKRDVAAVVTLTVLVTDTTAPVVQQGEGKLVITVIDINDHPPKFQAPWMPEKPEYVLRLQEELPVGTIVERYSAVDEDSNIAGYYIIPENEYFQINNGTGILQVKGRIDYEKTRAFNFTLFAYDSGTPQLNVSADVRVTVLNVNDNSPTFSEQVYNVTVRENSANGTHVITVNATDLDADEYGQVTYSLIGEDSENFLINEKTGEVSVANERFFDHETIPETVIQAVASDDAPGNVRRSVTVPVHVYVADVNDNAPTFNQSVYDVTVSETVQFNPPFPVLQVFAEDEDEGTFGNVHYRIVLGNGNGTFLLGEDTGVLYVHKSLSGEAGGYDLEIEARDESGNGEFTDTAKVQIRVLRVNEHGPQFIVPTLTNATVEIVQDVIPLDYLIMTVKAVDEDKGENGNVSYYLRVKGTDKQQTNEFTIDAGTGELKSRLSLDSRLVRKYELDVVAKDHGLPVAYEAVRHINILLVNGDRDAKSPSSENPNVYHFYVTENARENLYIGKIETSNTLEGQRASGVYYYLLSSTEERAFYVDKADGKLYTNKTFDREQVQEHRLLILASNVADLYLSGPDRERLLHNRTVLRTGSVANVTITINDLNDNAPKFEESVYHAAVDSLAAPNEFVTNLTASDPDYGVNGSFVYYIKTSNLYKYGSNVSSGSVIPSPFNVTEGGSLYTATSLLENNQHRFVVDVVAKEVVHPEREGFAKLYVWIFEPEQLIRIILSRPVEEVLKEKDEIISELSNATGYLIIVDKIRPHVRHSDERTNKDWSDVYILVIDPSTQSIMPVHDVLKVIDAKYDFLKDYYTGFAIENVVPARDTEPEDSFDPALSALIALLLVLLVGTVTFVVVCCCLRNWMISPSRLKKKDALINKAVLDDLNTTENPLWIEQKLKIYEEQELSMQVFNEAPEGALERRNDGNEYASEDNTYATIPHASRRGSAHTAAPSLAEDLADYATLSGIPRLEDVRDLERPSNLYEAAMGFQGSTFQVPRPAGDDFDSSTDEYQPDRHSSRPLTMNNAGQLEYVAELL